MFAKSMDSSFLQVSSSLSTTATSNAFLALKKAATEANSMRLASLAASVRMAKTGHFDGVIKAIDGVEDTLKDEGHEDIEKRDHCKEEYLEIESTVHELNWKIENNVAKIDKLQ